MAAFIPTVGGVRAELLYLLSGQQIENVFHVQYPTDVGTGTMGTLGTTLMTWWTAQLAAHLSEDISLRGCRLTDLSTFSSPVIEVLPGAPSAGTIVSPSLPNNTASVITSRTANRGRSYRGRTYIPGVPQTDQQTPTALSLAEITAFLTAFGNLLPIITALGGFLGVRSTRTGHAPRAAGVITPITTFDANVDFDSQRRRLAGRGK